MKGMKSVMKEIHVEANENGEASVHEKSWFTEAFEWIACFFIAFVIAVLVRYFLFTPTLVSQTSMIPTILDGERVLINRTVRTFKLPLYRGDIITFERPIGTADGVGIYNTSASVYEFLMHDVLEISKVSYIKRVIGIGGDHVEIRNGNVYVNEQKQAEVYLNGIETPITGDYYDITVPDGYVFVMGDNRGGSSDSREFGCIPLEKVEGRVKYRIWPLSRFGKIDAN